ncbi:MAG TPA: peptidoglycan-binding protein [Chthoniobacterales bacterium]|nr:peptidoglycan-binding protein [Chthoniobacterales bacterium]
MKKIITLLISCSFALATVAIAQQEDASPSPNKKQQRQERREKRAARQDNAQPPAAQSEQPAARPHAGRKAKERGAAMENNNAQTPVPATDATATAPNAKVDAQTRKERRAARQNANASEAATPAPAAKANARANGKAEAAPAANTAPANAQANTNKSGKPKRPANIQKIREAHASFKAQSKPNVIKSVTYNQNYTIPNSQNWQGEKYSVFQNYRPQRHDLGYYRAHYPRVELIAGGYYYFNAGYWYPAYTVGTTNQYYAYDGPIYAGREALPPDRVIADVQASLQEMGYYKGEVDGLLGPLTREALTGYQSDNGLYTTAAIDEPTLSSLGMGS